jgi:hypothetical protein
MNLAHSGTFGIFSVSGVRGRNARANRTTLAVGARAGRRARHAAGAPAVRVLWRGQYQPCRTDASIPLRRLSALLVPLQPAEATNRACITLRRAPQAAPIGRVRDVPHDVDAAGVEQATRACRPLGQLCVAHHVIYGGAWPTVPPHPAPIADQSTPAPQARSPRCRITSCWSSNAPRARHSSRSRFRIGVNGARPHRRAITLVNSSVFKASRRHVAHGTEFVICLVLLAAIVGGMFLR